MVLSRVHDANELVAPYQLESVSILVLVGLICTGLVSRCCAWRRRRRADGPVLSVALRNQVPRPRGCSNGEDTKLRPDVDDSFFSIDDDNFDDDEEQELD